MWSIWTLPVPARRIWPWAMCDQHSQRCSRPQAKGGGGHSGRVRSWRTLPTWPVGTRRFCAGKLLSAKQRLEEITPPELADGSLSAYALGLFVSDQSGRPVYDHVGQGLGFLTVNRIYPTESAAIVVLTNDSSSNAFAQIADRIAYLTVPPTPADAQARAVFASLQANRPERSSFTQDLNTYLDATMARQYAASLGPLGAPESFVVRSTSKADGITTRNYEVMAGGRKLLIVEQTLSDGRIESFQVQPAAH